MNGPTKRPIKMPMAREVGSTCQAGSVKMGQVSSTADSTAAETTGAKIGSLLLKASLATDTSKDVMDPVAAAASQGRMSQEELIVQQVNMKTHVYIYIDTHTHIRTYVHTYITYIHT